MNSTAGSPPGLGTSGLWHHRAMQRSRALVRTYLLSSCVPPLPPATGVRVRDPLTLPSLTAGKASHRQTTIAPFSISEPSLFTPGERAVFEGFSRNRRPPLHTQSSTLALCRTYEAGAQSQIPNTRPNPTQSSRPVYTHFSQPIRPNNKVVVKPGCQGLTLTSEQNEHRPLILQYRHLSQGEALSVRGKPCLPSSQQPPQSSVAPAPMRTQLHIFLPTEDAGEAEEADSESVDEGFMDEQDSKIGSLKNQQEVSLFKPHAP